MMTTAALRKKLGLSPSQFARALGVAERTVYRWEAGATPDGLAAEAIASFRDAIEAGVAPRKVGELVMQGVRRLLFQQLTR